MNFIQEARRILQKKCFVFDRTYVIEDAIEYYQRGLNELKLKTPLSQLLPIYDELLECYEHVNKYYDAGKTQEMLGNASQDVNWYLSACDSFSKSGHFHKVHDLRMVIANYYENKEQIDLAIEQCIEAIRTSKVSTQKVSNVKVYEKLVELYLRIDNYEKAIDTYDILIKESNKGNLLKYSVPRYVQRRLLLTLAVSGKELTLQKLEDFKDNYLISDVSTEYKFVSKLLNTHNLEELQNIVRDYHQIAYLTELDFKILVKIKESYYNLFDNFDYYEDDDWV